MTAAIISMANVGVLVVALRNHRLSENDTDEEFFFNLLVNVVHSSNYGPFYPITISLVNEFF
jgi:hypothetical protein